MSEMQPIRPPPQQVPESGTGRPLPLSARNVSPIVPRSTISGRALIAVVAIMTFLASITSGAVLLVRAAAAEWQSDIASEVTIQVRPAQGRDLDRDVRTVVETVRGTPGVLDVRAFSDQEFRPAARALARHRAFAERSARAAHDRRADRARRCRRSDGFAAATCAGGASASVDDHRAWIERMRTMTNAIVLAGSWHSCPGDLGDDHIRIVRHARCDGVEPADRRGAAFRRRRRSLHRQPFPAPFPAPGSGGCTDRRRCGDAVVRLCGIDWQLVFRNSRWATSSPRSWGRFRSGRRAIWSSSRRPF